MTETIYFSTKEVAELTGHDPKTIQTWALSNKTPGQIKMGRFWSFKKDEVKAALERERFLNESLPV